MFLSQQVITATVSAEGTAVPVGPHVTNGTVFSSNGEEFFNLNLVVTPAALRVIVLPSSLPQAVMRAGDAGEDSATSFATIYNVDTAAIQWHVENCTVTDPNALEQPMVSFSSCGGDSSWIDLASSIPVQLTFAAPRVVGIYAAEYTVVGTSTGSADWISPAPANI